MSYDQGGKTHWHVRLRLLEPAAGSASLPVLVPVKDGFEKAGARINAVAVAPAAVMQAEDPHAIGEAAGALPSSSQHSAAALDGDGEDAGRQVVLGIRPNSRSRRSSSTAFQVGTTTATVGQTVGQTLH